VKSVAKKVLISRPKSITMRYAPIDSKLFVENRRRFTEKLPPGAIAIFHSNDVLPTNADGVRPFIQDANLFWLTGIDQEKSICILFPDAPEPNQREMLFLKKTNKQIAIWEGHKYTKEEAKETSGIDQIHWLSSFQPILKKLFSETDLVFLPSEYHAKQNIIIPDANLRFTLWCQERFPLHQFHNAAKIIQPLRLIKSQIEIDLIKEASAITEAGFRRSLGFIKPGVWEYEIEAEFIHEFIRRRARGFAYDPIIGSGESSCVLHYLDNNKQCKDGDILLMDVGASYANYAADMTRTVPVNGKFTIRQKAVYKAVHRSLTGAKNLLIAGITTSDYNKAVADIIEEELVDLGLISMHDIQSQEKDKPAYMKYFMHKTAHSIGLDVHDVGDRYTTYQPGMIFTCEPGIYIPEEELGIRLENDILITEDGNIDLMQSIPIDLEEIEELMNS
jgi:Xaa-Pro aminopeptidase